MEKTESQKGRGVPKPWSLDWNQAGSKQHPKSLLKIQIAEAPLWKFYFKRNLLEKEVPWGTSKSENHCVSTVRIYQTVPGKRIMCFGKRALCQWKVAREWIKTGDGKTQQEATVIEQMKKWQISAL